MVNVPTHADSADNRDRATAARNLATAGSGHLCDQLRLDPVVGSAVLFTNVAVQDCRGGRVISPQGIQTVEGYGTCQRTRGHCQVHGTVVELDWLAFPPWAPRSMGPDVVRGLRGAVEAELHRVLGSISHRASVHAPDQFAAWRCGEYPRCGEGCTDCFQGRGLARHSETTDHPGAVRSAAIGAAELRRDGEGVLYRGERRRDRGRHRRDQV